MKTGMERRKAARIPHEDPVVYSPFRVILPHPEEVTLQGRGVDISENDRGIGFVTPHPVFTGKKLQLVNGAAAGTALVRWVSTAPDGYRVGVSILR